MGNSHKNHKLTVVKNRRCRLVCYWALGLLEGKCISTVVWDLPNKVRRFEFVLLIMLGCKTIKSYECGRTAFSARPAATIPIFTSSPSSAYGFPFLSLAQPMVSLPSFLAGTIIWYRCDGTKTSDTISTFQPNIKIENWFRKMIRGSGLTPFKYTFG